VLDSPFPYHGPLDPEQVQGRDDLVTTLVERITAHRPTVLIAPRRYGKTSILGRVAAELADTTTVVAIDLYELRSWVDLATRLDDALAHVHGPARRALDRLAASVQIDLGVVKATLAAKNPPPADVLASTLVDVLVDHARRTPTLIVLDEFSSIDGVTGAAGMLRTKLQHHYREIGLLFAGSRPSTMRLLFSDAGQPFYAQADLLDVPPLGLVALTDIIATGFDGRPPDGLAAAIFSLTHGHPQRSMQLADAAWTAAQADVDDAQVWEIALDRCRRSTATEHEARFADLATAEQAVLRLAAMGEPLYGAAAKRLSLAAPSARNASKKLVDLGLVHTDGTVVDPLFDDWIRTRF